MKENVSEKSLDYRNGTKAYSKFVTTISRTNNLLRISLDGLKNAIESHDKIVAKFEDARKNATKVEGGDSEGDNEIRVKRIDGDTIQITLNEDQLDSLENVMDYSRKEHKILDKYIYSILVVFMWGTFETYLNQVFSEIYVKQPSILKSEKVTFSSTEILEKLENPLELLVNKELNKIGHFKLKDWDKYLKNSINFEFDNVLFNKLSGIYLIRNIIAHNTGLVRQDQISFIPKELEIIEGEIVVTKDYLNESIDIIDSAVTLLESVIRKKFLK